MSCKIDTSEETASAPQEDGSDRSDPHSRDTVRLGLVYFGGTNSARWAVGPDRSDPHSRDTVRLGVVYFPDVGVVDGVMDFCIRVGLAEAKEGVGATQYG